jgi:tetratricopeptide (TPR) repeat protein
MYDKQIVLIRSGFYKGTLLFCVPLLLLLGCGHSPQAVRDRALDAGNKLLAKGDYQRAVLEFKNAVQAMPRDAESQYKLGNASAAAGNVVEAVTAYKRAVELNPKHADAERKLVGLMALLGDRGLVEEAEARLHMLLDSSPADMTALNTLAFAELKLGKRNDAIRHLEEVLAKAPHQMAGVILLAHAKLLEKDVEGAEAILKQAVAQNPNLPDAFVLLGRFYTATDSLPEAEQQFRRALQLQPKHAPALFYLGMLENTQGRKQSAEERFKALSTHPQKTYWPVYGMFLFQEGRKPEAVQEFERLYRTDLDDRGARTRLIAVYQALNRWDEAEKLVTTALSRNPHDINALLQRSNLRLERGKYTEAQNDLNQVLHDNPTLAEAHFLQARIYEKNGSILAERQELNETLQQNRLLLPARIALARLLVATKASKTALELLSETPAEQKASLAVLVERNWAFGASGDLQEMQKGVDEGLAIQRTPDLLVQNAWLKLDQRNFNEARTAAEEALRSAPEDVRALEVLARSYSTQNQEPLGVARVREYVSRQPQSAAVQAFLGKLLQSQGDMIGAREALSSAKAAASDSTETNLALAQLDLLESKWQDARQKINAILAQNSQSITARYWLAQVEEIQGNHKASIEQYRRVIAADPTHANALNNLAVLLGESGQASEALPLAQRAKELLPGNPAVTDTFGWVLYKNGLYSLAVRQLEEANSHQMTALRASHLSMAYWKAGSPDRARQALDHARKIDPSLPDVKEAQTLMDAAVPNGPGNR